MEKFGLWCKAIAVVSVVSSLVMLVLPESKTKKTFRILISLIIVYVILNPFTNSKTDFSSIYSYFETSYVSDLKEDLEDYEKYPLIVTAESEIKKYIDGLLEKYDTDAESEVECEYKDEKIFIGKVMLKGSFTAESKNNIEYEIKKICSESTLIIFSEADNE